MKAVILAGGLGRRLEPVTLTIPKVLAPVGDTPILEIVLRQLRAAGFREVVLALGHLGELVEAFVTVHRKRFDGLEIRTVYEDAPTGTAGALALVPGLDQTFLAMNGDVLTTLDYRVLVAAHRRSGARLTVGSVRQSQQLESGVLHFEPESGRLVRFEEKPLIAYQVSMGVYVYEPSVLRELPRDRPVDLPEVVQRLLDRGEIVHCFENDSLWYDIGTRSGYRQARERFEAEPESFLPDEAEPEAQERRGSRRASRQ
jgi:NDP-mannose synthase